MEISEKLRDSLAPIIEQQERIQRIVGVASIPAITVSSPALDSIKSIADNSPMRVLEENSTMVNALTESTKAMQKIAGIGSAVEALHNSSTVHALGEMAIKSAIPTYQFESPALKAIEAWSNSAVANLATGLTALIQNPVMQEIQAINTNLGK